LDGDEKGQLWRVVRRGGKDGMYFKKILHTGFFISWCDENDVLNAILVTFMIRFFPVNNC
jgi:hypothetical protein